MTNISRRTTDGEMPSASSRCGVCYPCVRTPAGRAGGLALRATVAISRNFAGRRELRGFDVFLDSGGYRSMKPAEAASYGGRRASVWRGEDDDTAPQPVQDPLVAGPRKPGPRTLASDSIPASPRPVTWDSRSEAGGYPTPHAHAQRKAVHRAGLGRVALVGGSGCCGVYCGSQCGQVYWNESFSFPPSCSIRARVTARIPPRTIGMHPALRRWACRGDRIRAAFPSIRMARVNTEPTPATRRRPADAGDKTDAGRKLPPGGQTTRQPSRLRSPHRLYRRPSAADSAGSDRPPQVYNYGPPTAQQSYGYGEPVGSPR